MQIKTSAFTKNNKLLYLQQKKNHAIERGLVRIYNVAEIYFFNKSLICVSSSS